MIIVGLAGLSLLAAWFTDWRRNHVRHVNSVATIALDSGRTVGELLEERHPDGAWKTERIDGLMHVRFSDASGVLYEWRVSADNIPFPTAANEAAEELTPKNLRIDRILERARGG